MPFYKVTFTKRFNSEGEEADQPESFVQVLDGVVLNAAKAEVIEPAGLHSQEVMDEDDAFLSIGTEVWEYEVADGRRAGIYRRFGTVSKSTPVRGDG